MKLLSSNKRTRKTKYIFLGLLVLLAFLVGLFLYSKYSQDQQKNSDEKKMSHQQRSDQIKKNADKKVDNGSTGLPKNSESTTRDQVPPSSTLSVIIISTSQENGKILATAQTNGIGTCVFEYTTEGDKPVIEQVIVNGTICQSSLPEVQFAKLGTWNLRVIYYNNGQKIEAQKDVTIR